MVRLMQIAISMTTTDLLHSAILCLFIVHLRVITRWLYSGDENPRAYLCAAQRKPQDTFNAQMVCQRSRGGNSNNYKGFQWLGKMKRGDNLSRLDNSSTCVKEGQRAV